MPIHSCVDVIQRKYREVFQATAEPAFSDWMEAGSGPVAGAGLGFRRASSEPLFLECYLDSPIEQLVGARLGRAVARKSIIEIGNFGADNAIAMVELWGRAANDLGRRGEVAVATLTLSLRRMFCRMGLPFTSIAAADPARLGANKAKWGSYYAADPWVCMGVIADGQAAISGFLSRRGSRAAA